MPPPSRCEQCGDALPPRSRSKRFCSFVHYSDFRLANRLMLTRGCTTCGAEITRRTRGDQTFGKGGSCFCSVECWSIRISPTAKDARSKPVGSSRVNRTGYVEVKTGAGWDLEHRYVMELHIGRPLWRDETVHHRNGDRADNRLSNLELWSRAQPSGQRVADKVAYAKEILNQYEPESLHESLREKFPRSA